MKKSYVIDSAVLIAEWDYERNSEEKLDPAKLTLGSDKKAYWICKEFKHSYRATIGSRARGSGCPYCAGQKILKGFNDLETKYPAVAKEWDYEKNGSLKPDMIMPSHKNKVWWIGSCGHSWDAVPYSRIKGSGCPYCAGQKVLRGFNDLETIYPELSKEWSFEKNDILPSEVTSGSGYKAIWHCSYCGHEWKAAVFDRVKGGPCPACSSSQTSFAECSVYYYVKQVFPSALRRSKDLGFEIDIYLPDKQIGIEYDGVFYHEGKKNGITDEEKDRLCQEHDIKLIRIREAGLNETPTAINVFRTKNDDDRSLSKCIKKAISLIDPSAEFDIDVVKDKKEIFALLYRIREEQSIAYIFPEIAKEWNYPKNAPLTPRQIPTFSHTKVWWICSLGHEWETTPHSRANGNNCPYCSGQKVLKGFNDLLTTAPELAEEWSDKNKFGPDEITSKSGKDVIWKCKICKKEWPAKPYNRIKGSGCPYCANKTRNTTITKNKISNGAKSLADSFPDIAKEWDYKANNKTPKDVLPYSHDEVAWICQKGHKYNAKIADRTKKGHGCPYCSGRLVIVGETDLQTVNPELASEWHPTKNGNLLPSQVLPHVNQKVWWLGKCRHEWDATINSRSAGRGCPYCANKKVLIGFNDLQTKNPELIEEWNWIKNGELKPVDFTPGSGKKVWWICKNGHEWEAYIRDRSKGKGRCKECEKMNKK